MPPNVQRHAHECSLAYDSRRPGRPISGERITKLQGFVQRDAGAAAVNELVGLQTERIKAAERQTGHDTTGIRFKRCPEKVVPGLRGSCVQGDSLPAPP